MAKMFPNTDPNTITWISIACAVLGGLYIYVSGENHLPVPGRPWFLVIAAFFIWFNSYFDALDGKVAKLFGKSTKRGDFLDHAGDRYSDLFILLGITFSSYCPMWIGLLAIVGVLLTSYMGTQAQALGIGRDYGGILGRAERQVMLTFVPLLQYILIRYLSPTIGGLTLFGWLMVLFAVAGNATALIRARKTWSDLG